MIGTSAFTDDCFSLTTDPHDTFGADQYLNLDDAQTQAESAQPMDFSGSSVGQDSLCGMSRPSPMHNLIPGYQQGPSTHQEFAGFATMPANVNNNLQMMTSITSLPPAQHLPGCPSHRLGSNVFQTPQTLSQHAMQPHGYDMPSHGWTSRRFPATHVQHHPEMRHAHTHSFRSLTPQAQNKLERPVLQGPQPVNQIKVPTSTSVRGAQSSGLPSPVSQTPLVANHSTTNSDIGTASQIAGDVLSEQGIASPVSTIGSGGAQDSEGGPGRRSHLYIAQPWKQDGRYHCPFEGQTDCTHEPVKLKCNYDKFIDSHLKPYRCAKQGCEELRFSSTACRLRHEREAHGSHGHGVNPYLCLYEGCERSKQDKGFPRAWNRNDHMKRCHGHIATAENEAELASPVHPAKPELAMSTEDTKQEPRKRASKQTENVAAIKRQKTQIKRPRQTSNSETHQSALKGLERQQRLHDEWRRRRLQLQEFVHGLQGPNDSAALNRIQSEVNALVAINQELSG